MWKNHCNLVVLLFGTIALLFQCTELEGKVKPSKMFSSDMVLQRNMPVPVWGWADKGEKITVKFNGQTKTAISNNDGKWMVRLDSMKACKKPQNMIITGENTIKFSNILVGEVWLCSGQSNMGRETRNCLNATKVMASSNNPDIRLKLIFRAFKIDPVENIYMRKWVICSPKTISHFSAAAYFFAQELNKELDVPIGVISSSVGGTRIEAWIALEGFQLIPELKKLTTQVAKWRSKKKNEEAKRKGPPVRRTNRKGPTMLYNGMIAPLIPYAIRGVIWYQGEANGNEYMSYFYKTQALIKGWRKLWNQGDFPFYFVQLPNYGRSRPNKPKMGDGWAKIREAQTKCLEISNSGMAVAIDIGEGRNIHPKNKQDVGKRLAKWALAKDYGKKVVYSGPLYKNAKIEGSKIRITFNHVGSGLMIGEKKGLKPVKEVKNTKLKWISICGKNKVWHWADAKIEGDSLLVSSDNVANPVAVRYAYAYNPEGCNLYNKEGLPASPFRTDDFK